MVWQKLYKMYIYHRIKNSNIKTVTTKSIFQIFPINLSTCRNEWLLSYKIKWPPKKYTFLYIYKVELINFE